MTEPVSRTPPVPLPDFERISRSILGILLAEKADITGSCLFFGIMGASILNRHYGLNAKAIAGQAAFNLSGTTAIAFANLRPPAGIEDQSFHCWVETNGWFLDFSSLVFPEIVASFGGSPCPRLMFQKPLAKAAPSIEALQVQGSFYRLPDEELTLDLIAGFGKRQAYIDLVNVVTQWYKRPPKKVPEIRVFDARGNHIPTVIAPMKFDGVWV